MRDYQRSLKNLVYQGLQVHRSVLAQLPTGGGKTHVIASVIEDALHHDRRVAVLVHRVELVEQVLNKITNYCNPDDTHNLIQAVTAGSTPDPRASVYIAMVQTMARREMPDVDIIIIDEAHHATAAQYRSVIAQRPEAKVLGFTATPCRLDGQGLAAMFDALVVGASMRDLITEGYLVDSEVFSIPLKDDSLMKIKTTAGDYNRQQLAEYVDRNIIHGDIVDSYNRCARGRKAIVYGASVDLSRRYAKEYCAAGIAAAHIDGGTPAYERARIVDAFRDGSINIITNCEIITEGFDVPDCEVIQLVRPTKSLSLYLQMVGRGMRAAENKKMMTIIDHVGNVLRHGFPDEDHAWTLAGKIKRPAPQIAIEDVDLSGLEANNGGPRRMSHIMQRLRKYTREELAEMRAVAKGHVDAYLLELVEEAETEASLYSLPKVHYGSVYQRWRASLKRRPTREELKWFAKRAGYHHRWVLHQ